MIISRRRADDKGRLLITTSNWSPELYNLLSLKLTLPVLLDGTVESLGSTEFYFGRKRKKTVCNTSLIILLTDVVNLESVYAILNLCASLVHCKNRSPTTLTFSAKAFPRPNNLSERVSICVHIVWRMRHSIDHCLFGLCNKFGKPRRFTISWIQLQDTPLRR